MDWVVALLIAAATAAPPDFSQDPNLRVLVPAGQRYETSIAVSGNNVVLAVISLATTHPIEIYISPNRGFTWSGPVEVPQTIDGVAYRYATDPTLIALDDGSFGLGYLVLQNAPTLQTPALGNERLLFSRSADGVTWSAPVTLVSRDVGGLQPSIDRPWLSVDRVRGTIYATWSRTEGSGGPDVIVQSSNDRGTTWSALSVVTPKGEQLANLAALPDGTLVEVDYDSNKKAFVSRYSSSGGAFWSGPLTIAGAGTAIISPGTKTQSPPMPILTTVRDDLYCVMPTATSISFTRSRDGGRTWSAPLQLGGEHGDAVLPAVAGGD